MRKTLLIALMTGSLALGAVSTYAGGDSGKVIAGTRESEEAYSRIEGSKEKSGQIKVLTNRQNAPGMGATEIERPEDLPKAGRESQEYEIEEERR